jgi:Flp pilus assembly protein TadB
MAAELPLFMALPLLACFIVLPAAAAWRRRSVSREASDIAARLASFAASTRAGARCLPLDETLAARLIRLRVQEFAVLQLAVELSRGDAPLLADAAQRLASRLRRRVAFERKMLARTAAGLWRGAIAASLPPLGVLLLLLADVRLPPGALATLLALEIVGCLLLWRLARVEI